MGLLDDWETDTDGNNQTGSNGTDALPPIESLLGLPIQVANADPSPYSMIPSMLVSGPTNSVNQLFTQTRMPTVLTDATQVDMPNVVPTVPWQTNRADPFGLRPFYIDDKHPHYRGQFDFSGVSNADSMSKYGTYTQDEADKIVDLKTNGANTSSASGKMSDKDKNYITNLSRAAQIDPETMLKIMAMESGSNPNAISPTGAIGKNQFVGGTADKVGIQDRFDADQNIRGAVIYARDNIQLLKAANLPITAENIYMMHQLGPGAGSEVIKAARDGTPISQLSDAARRGMSRNYGKDSDTAAEYIDANKKALNANYQRIVR